MIDPSYPFTFPVVALTGGADLRVHSTPMTLGLCSDKSVAGNVAPPMEIFTSDRVWRPIRIRAIEDTGRQLFGRAVLCASFDVERVRSFEPDELRVVARRAIENDPDDVWNQVMDHPQVLRAIDAASGFTDLARALMAAQGTAA